MPEKKASNVKNYFGLHAVLKRSLLVSAKNGKVRLLKCC